MYYVWYFISNTTLIQSSNMSYFFRWEITHFYYFKPWEREIYLLRWWDQISSFHLSCITHPVVPHLLIPKSYIYLNSLVDSMKWWSDRSNQSYGMPFRFLIPTITITTDASMEGWGGHSIVPRSGATLFRRLWTNQECQLNINVLELQVVCLALQHLEQKLRLIDSNRVWQYIHSTIHQQAGRSCLPEPQCWSLHFVPLSYSPWCPCESDSLTRSQEWVVWIPVQESSRLHRMETL